MTSLELMVANLDLQGRADRVARLDPEALRREALRAARDSDFEGLWSLVEAHLVTRGARGARVSANTLESYRVGLEQFLLWAGPAGVSLLRPGANAGFRYARHLEASKFAPSSVRVRLAAARSLYATLRWAAATDAAPFSDVRTASDPVPRWEKRQPYPPEDVATLLLHAGMQEAVIVLLGAHCGLRNTEMTTLLRKDVHLDAPHPYLIVTGKRQKRQQVPLSLTAGRAIRTWLAATPGLTDFVLTYRTRQGIEKALKKLCEGAGITYEGREVHGLRHSAGTRTYVESGDILAVRDHLRHRTVESSEIYVNYARAGKKAVNQDW
jgi:integrase/recombinase XerC